MAKSSKIQKYFNLILKIRSKLFLLVFLVKSSLKHAKHKKSQKPLKTVGSVNSLTVMSNTTYFEKFQFAISEDAIYSENDQVRVDLEI